MATHNDNAAGRGREGPGCHLEDALDAVGLLRCGLHNAGDARVLRRAVVHWRHVLQTVGQHEGAVTDGPYGAMGANGAEGDFVTRTVVTR